MRISSTTPKFTARQASPPPVETPSPEAQSNREPGFQSSVPPRLNQISPESLSSVQNQWGSTERVPNEVLVALSDLPQTSAQNELLSDYGAQVLERFELKGGDLLRLKVPQGFDSLEIMAAMTQDSRIAYAEPNVVFTADELFGETEGGRDAPDDMDQKLWGLHNKGQTDGTPGADVNALEAWKLSRGDGSKNGPLIAVIDTGIDYNHPDLAANMWTNPGEIPGDGIDNDNNGVIDDVYGYNAADENGDPMDRHSHGTHCAGTIGAVGNNGQGVTGVMQEAKLMAVKILAGSNRTTSATLVRGVLYAGRMGADITSNSWGMQGRLRSLKDAFATSDALHVIAAGNSSANNDRYSQYPANFDLDNIVAVAATDHKDQKAGFSNFAKNSVDVAAPGDKIYSTVPGGNYGFKSGTSMACPHVAGGAGLLLSHNPELTNDQLRDRLIYGSQRMTSLTDVSLSDGRVDFAQSLEQDAVAPGAPNDFEPARVTARSIDLKWTTVGDDKWSNGPAQTVEIRRSSSPITVDNFAEATAESVSGAAEVGQLGHFSYSQAPTTEAETLHFAMRSIDNVGNKSEIRTTTVTMPAAVETFATDFNSGEAPGFEATGDFQLQSWSGRGRVFGTNPPNEGAQPRSTLITPSIDLSDKSGAYLRLKTRANVDGRDGQGGRNDGASLNVSTDGGESWTKIHQFERFHQWRNQEFDLSRFDGETIQLKFNVETYPGSRAKGFSVDDIQLITEPNQS